MDKFQADLDETMDRMVPRIGLLHEEKVKLLSPELTRIRDDIQTINQPEKRDQREEKSPDNNKKCIIPWNNNGGDRLKTKIIETNERLAEVATEAIELQKSSEQLWKELIDELEEKVSALKLYVNSLTALSVPSKIMTVEEVDVVMGKFRDEYHNERNLKPKLQAMATSVSHRKHPSKEDMLEILNRWMDLVNQLLKEPYILTAGVQKSQYWITVRVELGSGGVLP